MPVNGITSALSGYVKQVAAGGNAQSGALSATAAAMQEANETAATTIKEALAGDPQAIRKLAQEQQQAKQLQEPPAHEAGKGETIDQKA